MGFEITDGTGKGNSVGVTSNNRILTSTIAESQFQYAAEEGDAYFFGTPIITASGTTETGLIIVTNNEDVPVIIGNFFFIAEEAASGSPSMFRANWYKNPTAINNGTSFSPLNQNFGSSKTLDVTAEYGSTSTTAPTGGDGLVATLSFPVGQFTDFDANLVLEKGSSVGVSVTPPAGNTNMPVQVGFRTIKYEELD